MQKELLDDERVFVIRDFLSRTECEALVARGEAQGYETFNIDGEVVPGFRNNSRAQLDDEELAAYLWEKAEPHLPAKRNGQKLTGLSHRFRFYRYGGGQAFVPHHDGAIREGKDLSQLTFMIYLSNVEKGGETRFYESGLAVKMDVQPEIGTVLVFDHHILHEGVQVEKGTKYVLRTDVMYTDN